MIQKFRTYYDLVKPGIVYANCLTATAGFMLASRLSGILDLQLLIFMLLGISFVIAGSCVFNNYLDRDIDASMERTKNRATVTGEASGGSVLIYAVILSVVGWIVLWCFVNVVSFSAAILGEIVYVTMYTPLKRKTSASTLIGSVAGAVAPVTGYCAVTGRFDIEAIFLFLIFALWQMPHFYSIAVYRRDEYSAASIPSLPIVSGIPATKRAISIYAALFVVAVISFGLLGYAGGNYFTVATIFSVGWLIYCSMGFKSGIDDKRWARRTFIFSLVVMIVLSLALML